MMPLKLDTLIQEEENPWHYYPGEIVSGENSLMEMKRAAALGLHFPA